MTIDEDVRCLTLAQMVLRVRSHLEEALAALDTMGDIVLPRFDRAADPQEFFKAAIRTYVSLAVTQGSPCPVQWMREECYRISIQYMLKLGLTEVQTAERLGVSRNTIREHIPEKRKEK